jgi:hypothetical protein
MKFININIINNLIINKLLFYIILNLNLKIVILLHNDGDDYNDDINMMENIIIM